MNIFIILGVHQEFTFSGIGEKPYKGIGLISQYLAI
jgi:hypothetical protein